MSSLRGSAQSSKANKRISSGSDMNNEDGHWNLQRDYDLGYGRRFGKSTNKDFVQESNLLHSTMQANEESEDLPDIDDIQFPSLLNLSSVSMLKDTSCPLAPTKPEKNANVDKPRAKSLKRMRDNTKSDDTASKDNTVGLFESVTIKRKEKSNKGKTVEKDIPGISAAVHGRFKKSTDRKMRNQQILTPGRAESLPNSKIPLLISKELARNQAPMKQSPSEGSVPGCTKSTESSVEGITLMKLEQLAAKSAEHDALIAKVMKYESIIQCLVTRVEDVETFMKKLVRQLLATDSLVQNRLQALEKWTTEMSHTLDELGDKFSTKESEPSFADHCEMSPNPAFSDSE